MQDIKRIIEENNGKIVVEHDYFLLVEVSREHVRKLARALFEAGAYYSTGVGSDERPKNGFFAMYHILNHEESKKYIVLKVEAPEHDLRIPSITPEIEGANWAEREAHDVLGIVFEGHPEPERLILPDDWPEGVYPLRKDFKYNEKVKPVRKEEKFVEREDALVLPLGPFHPTLHEPEYFEIYVDGETIVGARYKGFFIHRGLEKLAEGRLTIHQIPFVAERICGICGYTHMICYCQAVENAIGLEVPERAEYIRTLLLEIERIHSHILWFGVVYHLLGFDTGFMHAWRIREKVMDIAEMLTGNRKTYGMSLVGGVRRDIDEDKKEKTFKALREVSQEMKKLFNDVLAMKEILNRIEDVGILPKDRARSIGVVGPVARGSGINTDVRKDHPYAAYKYLDFKVPVYNGCDVLSRYLVRADEIFESIYLIEQVLDQMPGGDIMVERFEVPEFSVGVGATEAPRGEDVHFVITHRGSKVYRWRPRAPTYNNLPSVPVMLEGEHLADAPAIIGSIDPCFSCTDHVTIVDDSTGRILFRGPLEDAIRRLKR
ncbi:MAG: NADH-quinone oxidoreductase subunit C [Euryarchaeota archaeon]|nr:NADH-quinone oxidoreductase subunit C [Euryarchaeota archaeon]